MEDTIDLQELFLMIRKRFALIIVLAIVSTTISGVFTHFFVVPIYQTSTQLVLVPRANTDSPLTQGEIGVNLQMINTFNEVIISPMILDEVIEKLDLPMSAGSLRSMMSASNRSNAQVITLTVQNENPVLARDIADATAEVFKVEVLENFNMDNVRILAHAQIPRTPISPRPMINIAVGFMVGLMSGLFLVFLLEFLDKTIKSEQEVEKLINLPVIGVIPLMTADNNGIRRTVGEDTSKRGEVK